MYCKILNTLIIWDSFEANLTQLDFNEDIINNSFLVEGNPKAPFLIVTTPRCRGGRNSIPWIAPLYT